MQMMKQQLSVKNTMKVKEEDNYINATLSNNLSTPSPYITSMDWPNSYHPPKTGTSTTSIGSVVQNLHEGKYQFSDTQYLAGSSLVGQQFAESLYASCDNDHDHSTNEDAWVVGGWITKVGNTIARSSVAMHQTYIAHIVIWFAK